MSHSIIWSRLIRGALLVAVALFVSDVPAFAQRANGNVRSSSQTSVNKNVTVPPGKTDTPHPLTLISCTAEYAGQHHPTGRQALLGSRQTIRSL